MEKIGENSMVYAYVQTALTKNLVLCFQRILSFPSMQIILLATEVRIIHDGKVAMTCLVNGIMSVTPRCW